MAKDGKSSIENDDMSPDDFRSLIQRAFASANERLVDGGAVYLCSGWQSMNVYLDALMKLGMHYSGTIVWVKPSGVMDFTDYKRKTEIIAKARKETNKNAEAIIYAWKAGTHRFYGDNEYDVWEMPRKATQSYLHPTEKPDWLPMRAIRNSSKRGDVVLDIFAGSGSVMAAAEKTGRRAFMVELDPKFCDVIRDRWERIEKAKLENEAS